MTDTIKEIRARHEADAGLEEEDYVMSPDLTVQAHADRAYLLRALDEAQARAERAEAALRPFAAVAEHDIGSDETDRDIFRPMLTHNHAPRLSVGDLRRAAQTLKERNDV